MKQTEHAWYRGGGDVEVQLSRDRAEIRVHPLISSLTFYPVVNLNPQNKKKQTLTELNNNNNNKS